MIVTELYPGQGLGNQLWAYAACRSIAEALGEQHAILGMEHFKGLGFLAIDPGAVRQAAGGLEELATFRERQYYDPDLDFTACGFDSRVKALRPNTRLEGLFQSEDYFFGELTRPARYVQLREGPRPPIGEDVCILNIRGGEYKRHKRFILPREYWVTAMRDMRQRTGVERFAIVTDDPRYGAALFPDIPILPGGIEACYRALFAARFVIASNSTFSYFPLKTGGHATKVIAPAHWGRYANQFNRWASPANLYADWWWLGANGSLRSYSECKSECDATVSFYEREYFLAVPGQVLKRSTWRDLVPRSVKGLVKKVLSVVFPKHFG